MIMYAGIALVILGAGLIARLIFRSRADLARARMAGADLDRAVDPGGFPAVPQPRNPGPTTYRSGVRCRARLRRPPARCTGNSSSPLRPARCTEGSSPPTPAGQVYGQQPSAPARPGGLYGAPGTYPAVTPTPRPAGGVYGARPAAAPDHPVSAPPVPAPPAPPPPVSAPPAPERPGSAPPAAAVPVPQRPAGRYDRSAGCCCTRPGAARLRPARPGTTRLDTHHRRWVDNDHAPAPRLARGGRHRSDTLRVVDDPVEELKPVSDLSQIVKAYDVRGTVPDQWDERAAEALGAAFVQVLSESGEPGDAVRDRARHAAPPARAGRRLRRRRPRPRDAAVIEIGLASTDQLYYASGALGLPGAMFTASHNPAQYNGIKMCRAGARPVGQDSGLAEIRDRAQALLDGRHAADRRVAGPRSTGATCSPTTPRTCASWSTCRASARSRWWWTRATAWAATPCPSVLGDRAAGPAAGDRAALLRAGRHLPQPRGQPARPEEPGGPAGARCASTAPTSASPSTATPTAASSSTSAASRSPRPRSPPWSPPASWPSTRAARSSTT